MALYHDVFRFRGDGAVVPWGQIRAAQDEVADGVGDPETRRARIVATENRFADVQLRWMLGPTLGMSNHPFRVLRRFAGDEPMEELPPPPGTTAIFERVAAIVEVEVTAPPGANVTLSASRVGTRTDDDDRVIHVREMVAASSRRLPTGSGVLRVRCGGATTAQVSIGRIDRLTVTWLDEVLELDWEEVEHVGLPFEVGSYAAVDQGMVDAPTDPFSAAVERLVRGLSPIGWFPATESSLAAPPWTAPDPPRLVKEVADELFPRLGPLFDGSPAHVAAQVEVEQDVTVEPDPTATQPPPTATATLRPFDTLTLPPAADGALALALGFGTAYAADDQDLEAGARHDYLVVARFDDEIPESDGAQEIAAFIPAPLRHGLLTPPQLLDTRTAARHAPVDRDGPWRFDAQAVWAQVDPTAALERPTGAAFARADSGSSAAMSLLPPRASGGPRPLLPTTTVPDEPPPSTPIPPPKVGDDRWALVDGHVELPPSTGVRTATYCVALVDVFGVWSPWEDRALTARAPAPPRPGIADVALTARFATAPSACPSTTTIDVVVDWETRRPTKLHLQLVYFPTTRRGDPPGARPPLAPPADAQSVSIALSFAGETLQPPPIPPTGFTVTVDHVDEEGEEVVTPGDDQGVGRRRYRVRLTHLLDYASTRWHGVEVWARTDLNVGGSSAWEPFVDPDATGPFPELAVSARAASPVPPTPPPVLQGPDVPLGSTPDAQGRSHASVPVAVDGPTPARVSVWEVSESALRTAGGLDQRAPESATPSDRLVKLREVYDGLSPARRRAVFRRALTLDGDATVADVALPRGSTDIHLFALTATTAEGVESAWPQGDATTEPHEYLHAVIAPRVVSPAPPEVRIVHSDSGPEVHVCGLSGIPLERFELFATRSPAASRTARSMGLPVASVTPTVDTDWSPQVPAEVGLVRYEATVAHGLAPSWDPWLLRAVAVPVAAVGQRALRGRRSPDAPVVNLHLRPTVPPQLSAVTGRSVASDAVAFDATTDASARTTSVGDFLVGAVVESDGVEQRAPSVRLRDVIEVADPTVRPAVVPTSAQQPVLLRGARAGGSIPFTVWWQRPNADEPVTCTITVTDPVGRSTSGAGSAPAVVVDPAFPLRLVGDPETMLRGVGIGLGTKAPRVPGWVLSIVVVRRSRLIGGIPKRFTWSSSLADIDPATAPWGRDPIQVRRPKRRLPFPFPDRRRATPDYTALVRVPGPFTFTAVLTDPDGRRSVVSTSVGTTRPPFDPTTIPGPFR